MYTHKHTEKESKKTICSCQSSMAIPIQAGKFWGQRGHNKTGIAGFEPSNYFYMKSLLCIMFILLSV